MVRVVCFLRRHDAGTFTGMPCNDEFGWANYMMRICENTEEFLLGNEALSCQSYTVDQPN